MPHDAHPMGVLVSAMSALSVFHPDANPALRVSLIIWVWGSFIFAFLCRHWYLTSMMCNNTGTPCYTFFMCSIGYVLGRENLWNVLPPSIFVHINSRNYSDLISEIKPWYNCQALWCRHYTIHSKREKKKLLSVWG